MVLSRILFISTANYKTKLRQQEAQTPLTVTPVTKSVCTWTGSANK